MVEECGCRDARQWRAYWTEEAIAARLAAELDTYRLIRNERINEACNDVRGPVRIGDVLKTWHLPTHAEMHARRYGETKQAPG